jgi:hypothetical protein
MNVCPTSHFDHPLIVISTALVISTVPVIFTCHCHCHFAGPYQFAIPTISTFSAIPTVSAISPALVISTKGRNLRHLRHPITSEKPNA